MDVAAKKLQIPKQECFKHILNQAAEKIYTITIASRWTPKISAKYEIWS